MTNVIKDRHGTYYARIKVPPDLREEVARVLKQGKSKQVWLKRSLGTKRVQEANVRAKPVQMEFDRIIAQAREALKERPIRTHITQAELKRIADYTYAASLAAQDEFMREAPVIEADFRRSTEANERTTEWSDEIPEFGMSGGQMADARDTLPRLISDAEAALGRGDIQHYLAAQKIEDGLEAFQIRLDRRSPHYRTLGMEVLRAYVRALRDMAARYRGEPIETPPLILPKATEGSLGTLKEALEGWKKERSPSRGVLAEYERAVRLFTELHGDIPLLQIKRSHARAFREALQDLPRHRRADLLTAPLPELVHWSRKHPEARRITAATVNKLFGGVQTLARWAHHHGLIPDDTPWSDPFADMRLEEETPNRDVFTSAELNKLFASPVFTGGNVSAAGRGPTAFWLPLIALYTGARRNEIATLSAKDIAKVEDVFCFSFVEDKTVGKSLKTRGSARTVPVHPQLTKLGFLKFVDQVRRERGEKAWLFPGVAPDTPGGLKAWGKWFIRYLREHSGADETKVLHSMRHGFKDALRTAGVPEDLNDALTGHNTYTVGRSYGARTIVRRFGMKALKGAIDRVRYAGLKLPKGHTAGKPEGAKIKHHGLARI